MKPADRIRKLIENSDLTTGSEVDKRILGDALEHLEELSQQEADRTQQVTRRVITKSRVTQLAVAAVVIIAVLFTLPFITKNTSSPAFADVVKPILNARTVIMDILVGPEGQQAVIHDEVMGTRIRRILADAKHAEIIIDLEQERLLTLDHADKTAVYVELGGVEDIQNYVEQLRNTIIGLQNEPDLQVENKGLQEINGQEYLVLIAGIGQETVTVWADTETALPIRVEHKTPNMQIVCDNMQFDVELDESRFSMEAPDGYVIQDAGAIDFRKSSESDFIETLRIWAEIIEDDHFPESINLESVLKVGPKFDQGLKRARLAKQQQLEVATRWAQGLVFIRFFEGQGQWHWNGAGVELGDAESPIFWYHPKDAETWRVIYGDLRVEDVAEQDLPEPVLTEKHAKTVRSSRQFEKQEFVGIETDVWHITAPEDIVAHSNITLTEIPPDVSTMYIKLPYACGVLESAKLNNKEVSFSPVTKGRYELELSLEQLHEGQATIECIWSMPLDALVKADYGYRINLRGLIPVTGFKLTAVLEEDCGFEFTEHTKDPSIRSLNLFSAGNLSKAGEVTTARMTMGSCGLPVDRSN